MPRAIRRRSPSAPLTWALRGVEQFAQRGVDGPLLGHAQVHRDGGEPDLGAVVQVALEVAQRHRRGLDRDRPGPLELADPARPEQGTHQPGVDHDDPPRQPHADEHAHGAHQRRDQGARPAMDHPVLAVVNGGQRLQRPHPVPDRAVAEQHPHQRVRAVRQADHRGGGNVPLDDRNRQLDPGVPDSPPAAGVPQPPTQPTEHAGAGTRRRGSGDALTGRQQQHPAVHRAEPSGNAESGDDQRQADDRADDGAGDGQRRHQHGHDHGEPGQASDRVGRAEPHVRQAWRVNGAPSSSTVTRRIASILVDSAPYQASRSKAA
jgi:hypothetical protein